jgi:Flp pilus assembly protein TadG
VRGTAFPYLVVVFVCLVAFCSLGVEVGHVLAARGELQHAADAAARYAVTGLSDGYLAARDRALAAAAENKADGAAVSLDPAADVEFGTWDPYARTFNLLSGTARDEATAVRVTARRIAARGTAVPLYFARLIGRSSFDTSATAIATVAPKQYGLVGLDYVKLWGNSTNSYWSGTGTTKGNWGGIASNGDISLGGSSTVVGDARPGPGHGVSSPNKVSGVSSPLPAPLSYPPADPSPYNQAYNDNGRLPAGMLSGADFHAASSGTVPGGTYFVHDFRVDGSAVLTFKDPTVVYVYGAVSVTGQVSTSGNLPRNLRVVTVRDPLTNAAPGAISLGSNAALYADIYAPLSPLTVSGSGDIYGSVVAKSVDMSGTSAVHFDVSLRNADGGIRIVR